MMRPTISGNLYGLRERVVASASLVALAEELQRSKGPLLTLVGPSDTNAVEQFFQVGRWLRLHCIGIGPRVLFVMPLTDSVDGYC